MAEKASQQFRHRAEQLLDQSGETYAHEAGIPLKDKPSPLYQLLVLTTLLSTRISSSIATAAAREIFRAGWRTPRSMADASWDDVVDALGRAHYRRYDESTATTLGEGAELLIHRWRGDLRRLRSRADGDAERIRELLQDFPRIGPIGADIFCREAQGIWLELRPAFDRRALRGAQKCHLPKDPARLEELVAPKPLPRLAAALVRSTV